MGRLSLCLASLAGWLGMIVSAGAICPTILTDCPSPTYNLVTSGGFQVSGTSTNPLVGDSSVISGKLNGLSGSSAANLFHSISGSGLVDNADAVRGTATATFGSTTTNVNGIAGYILNNNPGTSTGQNAVSVYGVGIGNVNNAATWGINMNLTDSTSVFATTLTGEILNNELDFNVTSPNTKINGLVLQGSSVSQPASASGFVVSNLHLGFFDRPWNNAFLSNNGAATTAFFIGTNGNPALASQPSQNIAFVNTNASAVQTVTLMSTSTNGLTLTGPGLIASTVVLSPFTVATLPTCNSTRSGAIASVIDAVSPTYNGALTGGGGVHVPVFCNATSWTAH